MRQTPQPNLFKNQSTSANQILENAMRQQMHTQPNMPTQIDKPKYKPIPPGFKMPSHPTNSMIPEPSMKSSIHSNGSTYQIPTKLSNQSTNVKNTQQTNLNPKLRNLTKNVSTNRS